MKNRFTIIATTLVLLIVVGGAVLINYNMHSTVDTMKFIEGRIRPGGTFIDYDNSIGVTSAEDLGWWKKDGVWYVMYGKLQLEFSKQQLRDKAFLGLVSSIGLDIRGDLDEGVLRFYWLDTELEEWVPQ